ncbi:peptidoglycan-binding domain-containing protein [soil metagenome]
MAYALTWLPDVLEAAGLKVAEQPGWMDRGVGNVGATKGVICHHTAGGPKGNMPSLGVITNGRAGLHGPLAQLGLGRDGTYYVIAAGRAQHAGKGEWGKVTTGNTSFIGIEAENTGLPDDPWPAVQMDAYQRGVAAILRKIGADESMCCGHKEYALPKGRKPDPLFDMDDFRAGVRAVLDGTAPPPTLIPAVDAQSRATLRRGAKGASVSDLQRKLGLAPDGVFGPHTEAAVREFQRSKGAVQDGIVGPKTWAALDAG